MHRFEQEERSKSPVPLDQSGYIGSEVIMVAKTGGLVVKLLGSHQPKNACRKSHTTDQFGNVNSPATQLQQNLSLQPVRVRFSFHNLSAFSSPLPHKRTLTRRCQHNNRSILAIRQAFLFWVFPSALYRPLHHPLTQPIHWSSCWAATSIMHPVSVKRNNAALTLTISGADHLASQFDVHTFMQQLEFTNAMDFTTSNQQQ